AGAGTRAGCRVGAPRPAKAFPPSSARRLGRRSGGDQRDEGEERQRDEANRNISAGDAVDPFHALCPRTHPEVIEARVVSALALTAGRTRAEPRTRAGIVPG